MSSKNYKAIVLSLSYMFSLFLLVMFLLMADNKYAWMLEDDPLLTLPTDPDLKLKIAIFGVPLLLSSAFTVFFSFLNFGRISKLVSILFALTILLLTGSKFLGLII